MVTSLGTNNRFLRHHYERTCAVISRGGFKEKGPVSSLQRGPFSCIIFPFWLTQNKFQWFLNVKRGKKVLCPAAATACDYGSKSMPLGPTNYLLAIFFIGGGLIHMVGALRIIF